MSSINVPITLPSGPPVRSDHERALERIKELEAWVKELKPGVRLCPPCALCGLPFYMYEAMVGVGDGSGQQFAHQLCWERARADRAEADSAVSEEERLKACEDAKNTQLRLDESLAREAATTVAAKEILARIENLIAST